jgi:hypothetical protein
MPKDTQLVRGRANTQYTGSLGLVCSFLARSDRWWDVWLVTVAIACASQMQVPHCLAIAVY